MEKRVLESMNPTLPTLHLNLQEPQMSPTLHWIYLENPQAPVSLSQFFGFREEQD